MKKMLAIAVCLFALSTVVGCTAASSGTSTPAKPATTGSKM